MLTNYCIARSLLIFHTIAFDLLLRAQSVASFPRGRILGANGTLCYIVRCFSGVFS